MKPIKESVAIPYDGISAVQYVGLYKRVHGILGEVRTERERQIRKWGLIYHPLHDPHCVTRGDLTPMFYGVPAESSAKALCEYVRGPRMNNASIIVEELAESLAAPTEEQQREELIQLAACCVQAVEALDNRKAKRDAEKAGVEP